MPSSINSTNNQSAAQRAWEARNGTSEGVPTTPKDLSNFFSGLVSTHVHQHAPVQDESPAELPPLPSDDDSLLHTALDHGEPSSQLPVDESALEELGITQKLLDVESSFLPEPALGTSAEETTGTDDTYLFGGSPGHGVSASHAPLENHNANVSLVDIKNDGLPQDYSEFALSPPTPSSAYQTPAPIRNVYGTEKDEDETPKTSQMYCDSTPNDESISSSPAAAAAKRTMSRNIPTAVSTKGALAEPSTKIEARVSEDEIQPDSNPPRSRPRPSGSHPTSGGDTRDTHAEAQAVSRSQKLVDSSAPPSSLRSRPSFLQSRHASHRSSKSTFTTRSDLDSEAASEATLGADYALQTGGALPSSSSSRPSHGLSRLPSFSSVASSVSAFSEVTSPRELSQTHSSTSITHPARKVPSLTQLVEERRTSASPPETPRPGTALTNVTDTVIVQHVLNIHVPETVAREYRERHRSRSPDKQQALPTPFGGRGKHTMTLKEQNSRMDKLGKENFDLKLKIHYLDQALQARSDEGVRDMITKNVQLQTDLVNLKKDNQALRRKVRDLEHRLKEQEDGLGTARERTSGLEDDKNVISPLLMEMEEEIIFLKETLEALQGENKTLKRESVTRDIEKQRLTECLKSMGEHTNSETNAGVEETMDMWKDLLQAETARREQADEDALKLREEIARLRNETFSSASTHNLVKNIYRTNSRNQLSYSRSQSRSGSSDKPSDNKAANSNASSTLVEQLKHENAELRRDLGAQTSMLTSRNRERERLQAEIENLRLTYRKGDGVRSSTGDSIFERSVSRQYQRSRSRASGRTGTSQLSGAEREEYERKEAALRDVLAAFKMENQELDRELNGHVDQLEALEEKLRMTTESLQAIQTERNEALLDFESLKQEAQESIYDIENQLEQRELEIQDLNQQLAARTEDNAALQHEVRLVSDSVVRLEDSQESQRKTIRNLQSELQDANAELEALDKQVLELTQKKQRLEVQEESSRDEIKFLREEQEGDKMKIGELESALRIAKSKLQDEKDRVQLAEQRLVEQLRQRDLLEAQDKQEFQRVLDDLKVQVEKGKDEAIKLRTSLQSKELEASTHKDHLDELEASLRHSLGNQTGSRSSLAKDITRLQRDLHWTARDLEKAKAELLEKERLLKARDTMLEGTGLENRKLSELLEKERQARKHDAQAYEADKRKTGDSGHVMHQHEARIHELEMERNRDRKKRQTLERVYEDQLVERNNLLLTLWSRLSGLCGPDWVKKYAYVNGEVPSIDVIARDYPGFYKNLVHALKTVEGLVGGFENGIAKVEEEVWGEYQALEHALDDRIKRLDQVEKLVLSRAQVEDRTPSPSSSRSAPHTDAAQASKDAGNLEMARLRAEVDMLKAELRFNRPSAPDRSASQSILISSLEDEGAQPRPASERAHKERMQQSLFRHHSTAGVESASHPRAADDRRSIGPQGRSGHLKPPPLLHGYTAPIGQPFSPTRTVSAPHPEREPQQPPQRHSSAVAPVPAPAEKEKEKEKSDKTWVARLKEMERRLRAEREGRLLDRSGARKRLEQGKAEKEELRRELERERIRRETGTCETGGGMGTG